MRSVKKIKRSVKKILKKSKILKRSKKKLYRFSSLFKKNVGGSLFFRINTNIKNLFNKNIKFFDVYKEIKNIDSNNLKKERTLYISHLQDPSLIRNLYLHNNFTISLESENSIGSLEYIGYNFIQDILKKSENGVGIGTWINNDSDKCVVPLVNIYKSYLHINGITIENIRFGTVVKCVTETDLIRTVLQKLTRKKIINLSLLTYCSGLCKVTSSVLGHGSLSKINQTIKYEPYIIKNEEKLNNSDFSTIFLPMASKKSYGLISLNKPSDIKHLNESIKDTKVVDMLSMIDLHSQYKSIIKIFIYYFLNLKDEYVMAMHCKSAKDRTSVIDALFKSVMTVMSLKITTYHDINSIYNEIINDVEKWFPEYLKIGLVITYYSTGLYGLKIKNSVIVNDLKRILGPKFDFYLGLQKFIKDEV